MSSLNPFQSSPEGNIIAPTVIEYQYDALHAIPVSDLNRALAHSTTAHSYVEIDGYDVTLPWGDSRAGDPLPGWFLQLTSSVDVSAANASAATEFVDDAIDPGLFPDIFSLVLRPPEQLYTDQDTGNGTTEAAWNPDTERWREQWRWSVGVLFDLPESSYAKGREDDGSCNKALSKQCVDELKQLALEGGDTVASAPSSCHSPSIWWNSAQNFTDDMLTYAFYGMASSGHAEGEVLAYGDEEEVGGGANGLRGRTYPVVVRWEGARLTEEDQHVPDENVYMDVVSLACLNFESSESMEEVEYASGVARVTTLAGLLIAAVAAVALMA